MILTAVSLLCLAQELPTIRVPVRLVTAPSLVLGRDGRIISGLERPDFQLFDNGQVQDLAIDSVATPVSVAVVVQVSREVREYVPFMARVGSVVDALLVGERGQAAVIAYNDEVTVLKQFGSGNVQNSLRRIQAGGRHARMVDAGLSAIAMLRERPRSKARVLLLIGQPLDHGSRGSLTVLLQQAELENVTVYALALPIAGKAFVSDTFSLEGLSGSDKQGYRATVNLGKLVPALSQGTEAAKNSDPFSMLIGATGGTALHFRKQRELEDGISIVGVELRSEYLLSYRPSSADAGYHTIRVVVNVPDARVFTRPGYWREEK